MNKFQIVHNLLYILSVGIYLDLFSSPLIFMILYQQPFSLLKKVRVQDCSVYTDCGQCLGSKDPYCGWCSLENKCSLRGDCRDAAQDPLYWISYKSGRCTTITSVQPNELQRTTARYYISPFCPHSTVYIRPSICIRTVSS